MDRNIVIIAGQNSIGKTTTFNTLANQAAQLHIPYESRPLSDLFFLLSAIERDDAMGGSGHYHEWTQTRTGGHTHGCNEPKIPFTVTSNEIVDNMFGSLFSALEKLPNDRLVFVEWTGGRNINSSEEPAAKTDFSFERTCAMLEKDRFPSRWLERVAIVIHPVADNETRRTLNESKHSANAEEIATGRVSPKKGQTVLDIFGTDDFSAIETLFRDRGIPVYAIKNDGNCRFTEELREIFANTFSRQREEKLIDFSNDLSIRKRL